MYMNLSTSWVYKFQCWTFFFLSIRALLFYKKRQLHTKSGKYRIRYQADGPTKGWKLDIGGSSLFIGDAGAIAGQGGQQERKGTEDHIQQIFIILFPNHALLIFLGSGFVLIRE